MPLPRGLVVILGATGLLVTTLALKEFSAVLAPVLLALVLVICVHPLTATLTRRGMPRWLASTTSLVAVLAVVLGLALSFAFAVARLGTLLPAYQNRFAGIVADVRGWLAGFGVGPDQLQAALGQVSFGRVVGVVTDVVVGLANTFTSLAFLLLVVAFMCIDAGNFARRLGQVDARRNPVVTALAGFVHGTRKYLLVSTVFGLITGAVNTAFLLVVGVPLALLWGLLAFVTNYIPNIGFLIGLVPPALLALREGGPRLMLLVIAVYVAINFVVQSVIQPKYVGDAVNLSLTLTFLYLVFWSFVIGPIGAVLAVPLTLLAKALLLDVDADTRWISGLVASGRDTVTNDDTVAADVGAVPDEPEERDRPATPTPPANPPGSVGG